jgi:tetratricopeptide (TPR) repeat protein
MDLDVARAAGYYRQALEFLAADHQERARVLVQVGQTAYQTGRFADGRRAYEEAIAAFRARGDAVRQGDVLVKLSVLLWSQGETSHSQTLVRKAIELLEHESPGPELAVAYGSMSSKRLESGDAEEALSWAEKASALAEVLDTPDAKVIALERQGQARVDLDDFEGLIDLRKALDLALSNGLAYQAARVHANLAEVEWAVEGPATALETRQAGIEFAERRGLAQIAMWLRAGTLVPLFDLGSWDELLRVSDQIIQWDQARGGHYATAGAELVRAHVLLVRGELQAAASLSDEFLGYARDVGDAQVLVPALATAALIQQAQGRLSDAVRMVKEFDWAARGLGAGMYRGQYLPDVARVCVAAKDLALAQDLLERTKAVGARSQHGLQTGWAVLTEARGDFMEAARLYDEVAHRWAEYGHVLEHGQALFGVGRSLLTVGEPNATDEFDNAHAVFARLSARPLMAEVDAWLSRARTANS